MAECLSHEVGRTLGLGHQSTAVTTYYGGQGSGETGWAPIMGASYNKNLTQWSKGEYSGANNKEDAHAVMGRQGLNPRADDHGNTFAQATRVFGTVSNGWLSLAVNGVIETPTDVDTFSFVAGAGKLTLGVTPSAWSGNVDMALELRDGAGKLMASSNPAAQLGAQISVDLPAAGLYFLSVRGAGKDDPRTTGYSPYGSIDQYAVSGRAAIAVGVVDDHGGSRGAATALSGLVKAGVFTFAADGVIGDAGDADFFKLALVAGRLIARAVPLAGGDNLVLGLELQDAAGKVVASSGGTSKASATLAFDVPVAGPFYLRASGKPKNAANGLYGYGAGGQYNVSGTQAAAVATAAGSTAMAGNTALSSNTGLSGKTH